LLLFLRKKGEVLICEQWGEGAIGTARWTGVSLKKVIKYCGGLKNPDKPMHLEFLGADTYFKQGEVFNYAVSVPWRKVKANEVILAWEMNGQPLPKIHGFPLRTVVFGYIGARSCKWLTRINVLDAPSEGPVQKKEYLYYNSQIGKHNVTYSAGFSIQDMPVSSAIMSPVDADQIIHDGKIKMRGWAYSGGGHWPVRVEVSNDGGSVWYEVPHEQMSEKYYYAWRVWEYDLPVDAEGWLELVVRCWDNSMNTQPTFVRSACMSSPSPLLSHWIIRRLKILMRNRELGSPRHELVPQDQGLQHQQIETQDSRQVEDVRG
jgi:sulfite oxidase